MEELKNEQISNVSQTAEAEEKVGEVKGEISLGKFKDVSALLNAYNSLEAEFTKRCQKLKELEGNVTKVDSTSTEQAENFSEKANKDITDEEKEQILKEYLKDLLTEKKKMVFLDNYGVAVKTRAEKPKTIDEAGSLAKSIFNN